MTFDIVTIFPAMIERALEAGIVGRAIDRGTLEVAVHDLRAFTTDRHRVVDDAPYGGGPGMVMKPEPLFRAIEALQVIDAQRPGRRRVILTSPQGRRFTQDVARELSADPHLVLLCGRYEGIDERVRTRVDDLLDFPHYTRPAELIGRREAQGGRGDDVDEDAGLRVPAVLLSGNHAAIRRWRKREAIVRTLERRPDLLTGAALDDEEHQLLREIVAQRDKGDEDGRH
jgi:tRNA (guanine37-N1)-methyltransferase